MLKVKLLIWGQNSIDGTFIDLIKVNAPLKESTLTKGGYMKTVTNTVIGIIVGCVIVCVIGWVVMPKMMLKERRSPYDVEKTVEQIKANALSQGWVVSSVIPLHKSVKKHGDYDLKPTFLINLCQASHAFNILKTDTNKIVSVMMPCTISVYEKNDGTVFIGTMNAGLLGKMFGGDVARIMGDTVAKEQMKFISFAMGE